VAVLVKKSLGGGTTNSLKKGKGFGKGPLTLRKPGMDFVEEKGKRFGLRNMTVWDGKEVVAQEKRKPIQKD